MTQRRFVPTRIAPDLSLVSSEILAKGSREVDMLMAAKESLDGAGETVLIRGDVSERGMIHSTRALVVEGNVLGSAQAPCHLESDGPIVVMGVVRFAYVKGQAIYLAKGARSCRLYAKDEINVHGDLIDVELHIGNGDNLQREITDLNIQLAKNKDMRDEAQRQIKYEKGRLNGLLQATGIVFNLNIGHIVRQEPEGLFINLSSFYNALGNRTEKETDLALKEFFAKAILGLLTRLNQGYISEGPGHRSRFAAVVGKLRDLVMLTRHHDKLVLQSQKWENYIWESLVYAQQQQGVLRVAGGIWPQFHVSFTLFQFDEDKPESLDYEVKKLALTVRKGNVKGKDEVVFLREKDVVDLQFVASETLGQNMFFTDQNRIKWEPLLSS